MIPRARRSETLDAMLWRLTGRGGTVEATLDANPGLADLGPWLPDGTAVAVPETPIAPPPRALVNLWD
ncbi:MAG: tail protein X [Sphingomonadaceae bacterium]|nr:tail protein X [Sphingomonadaceae bacterium]